MDEQKKSTFKIFSFNCGKGIEINEGQRLKSQNKGIKHALKNFPFLKPSQYTIYCDKNSK